MQICGVRSSWEGRYTPIISALPFLPLWCLRLKVRLSSTFPSACFSFLLQFTIRLWNGCCAILFMETFCKYSVCFRFYCAWADVFTLEKEPFQTLFKTTCLKTTCTVFLPSCLFACFMPTVRLIAQGSDGGVRKSVFFLHLTAHVSAVHAMGGNKMESFSQ
jgi:hypothetical protein